MTSEFDTPTGDPVQVARDGVAEARAKLHDVVIVDTAGRLGVDAELMQQARNIRDAIEPQEVLFVIDAMTRPGCGEYRERLQRGRGLHRCGAF